jgi:hypothetical protein
MYGWDKCPPKTDTSQRGSHTTFSPTLATRRSHLCGQVQTSAAFTLTNTKRWALVQVNGDERTQKLSMSTNSEPHPWTSMTNEEEFAISKFGNGRSAIHQTLHLPVARQCERHIV